MPIKNSSPINTSTPGQRRGYFVGTQNKTPRASGAGGGFVLGLDIRNYSPPLLGLWCPRRWGMVALIKSLGFDFSLDRLPAAVIALSLNVAAYLAEIMRGGIESIDKGQWEACSSLGMNPVQTMKDVIFPQAFRRMLPPLGNEFITLIKDTSLAAVIGFEELFRQGQLEVATTYQAFQIYIAVALVYLVLTTLSSYIFKRIEKAMDPIRRARKASEKLERLATQQ